MTGDPLDAYPEPPAAAERAFLDALADIDAARERAHQLIERLLAGRRLEELEQREIGEELWALLCGIFTAGRMHCEIGMFLEESGWVNPNALIREAEVNASQPRTRGAGVVRGCSHWTQLLSWEGVGAASDHENRRGAAATQSTCGQRFVNATPTRPKAAHGGGW